MQLDIFLFFCGHYLNKQNCSKTEVQSVSKRWAQFQSSCDFKLVPSFWKALYKCSTLVPIFSSYIFKEVSLLARNLESNSLPLTTSSHSFWLRHYYVHKYIGTKTYVCTRILPTPFFTASLKEHLTHISVELLNPPVLRCLEFKQNRLASAYRFEEHLSKYKSELCPHLCLIRKSR